MMQPLWIGCPDANFRSGRPQGFRPEAIVIHCIDGSFYAGEQTFLDPTTQKSAHYAVAKTGVIHQYVDEHDVAFHAGVMNNPTWPLLKNGVNPNFYTIGIEHEGRPDDVWTDAQLKASAELVGQIADRWEIPLDTLHVIRHHEIRASKTCPGNFMLNTQQLLDLVPANAPLLEPSVTTVRTLSDVNVRLQKPTTNARIVRVIPIFNDVTVTGFVPGERVKGNSYWYADIQGNFFWAGATDFPNPTTPY